MTVKKTTAPLIKAVKLSGQDYLLLQFAHIKVTVSKVDGGVEVENLNRLVLRSLGTRRINQVQASGFSWT